MHQGTFEDLTDAVEEAREEWDRAMNQRLREMVGHFETVLDEAGYLDREHTGPDRANVYDPAAQSGAGEVELPGRDDAVASSAGTSDPGRDGFYIPHIWNVRVASGEYDSRDANRGKTGVRRGAPPAPRATEVGPPDD